MAQFQSPHHVNSEQMNCYAKCVFEAIEFKQFQEELRFPDDLFPYQSLL